MSLQPTKLSPWSRKMIPPPPLVRCRWIWGEVFACRCRNPASFPSRLRCGGRCSLQGDCVETWWFDKSPDGLNKVDDTLGESCGLLQTGAILWFCILWGVEVWDEEDLRRKCDLQGFHPIAGTGGWRQDWEYPDILIQFWEKSEYSDILNAFWEKVVGYTGGGIFCSRISRHRGKIFFQYTPPTRIGSSSSQMVHGIDTRQLNLVNREQIINFLYVGDK